MTDVDYTEDLVFLVNTPARAELLLHSLEKAAKDVSLYVNVDKTDFWVLNKGEPSPPKLAGS